MVAQPRVVGMAGRREREREGSGYILKVKPERFSKSWAIE